MIVQTSAEDDHSQRVEAVHLALLEVRMILRDTRAMMSEGNIIFGGLVSVREQRRVRGPYDEREHLATARLPDRRSGPSPSKSA